MNQPEPMSDSNQCYLSAREAMDLFRSRKLSPVELLEADLDAFGADIMINGRPQDPEFGWIMTYPFNMLSRCPVMSVPSGLSANGVPTGIQIVGRTFDGRSVFRAAAAFETKSAFVRPRLES